VVRIEKEKAGITRDEIFKKLRASGIGVNVHYIPVHLHPFYRKKFGTYPGLCPQAEAAYEQLVSLPIFPALNIAQIETILNFIKDGGVK